MEKILPSDIQAERVVLGTIFKANEFSEVANILTAEMFYEPKHKDIFTAICTLHAQGEECDIITINNELKKKGRDSFEYLIELQGCFGFNVYQYACIIQEKYIRRRFWTIAKELERNAYMETVDITEVISGCRKELEALTENTTEHIINMTDAVQELIDQINRNSKTTELTGMPTRFEKFDRRSGGLQGSDLAIIAGETSQGKTSLADNLLQRPHSAFHAQSIRSKCPPAS